MWDHTMLSATLTFLPSPQPIKAGTWFTNRLRWPSWLDSILTWRWSLECQVTGTDITVVAVYDFLHVYQLWLFLVILWLCRTGLSAIVICKECRASFNHTSRDRAWQHQCHLWGLGQFTETGSVHGCGREWLILHMDQLSQTWIVFICSRRVTCCRHVGRRQCSLQMNTFSNMLKLSALNTAMFDGDCVMNPWWNIVNQFKNHAQWKDIEKDTSFSALVALGNFALYKCP